MLIWLIAGLATAWLMYHDKPKIPVVKAILIVICGWIGLIVWALFNLGYAINNPTVKKSE
jgi:hypothetical protein